MATHSSEVDQYNEVEERLRREAPLSQLGLVALISNPLSAVLETACRMAAETLALDSVRIVKLGQSGTFVFDSGPMLRECTPGQFEWTTS